MEFAKKEPNPARFAILSCACTTDKSCSRTQHSASYYESLLRGLCVILRALRGYIVSMDRGLSTMDSLLAPVPVPCIFLISSFMARASR